MKIIVEELNNKKMSYYSNQLSELTGQISVKFFGAEGSTKQMDVNNESIDIFINYLQGLKRELNPKNSIELTRIQNDLYGNPRYVVHYLEFFKPGSKGSYEQAVKAANKIGGKKYNTKNYGGGIVFQSYNTDELKKLIIENRI